MRELETANEELKSSNEELVSMNEELQSANEELETSKEEIRAGSEAMERVNVDLENLLRSSDVGTLFLNDDLVIQRFTPAVTQIYNLIPGDIGRPLAHITHRAVDMPPLPNPLLLDDEPVKHEFQLAKNGRWYLRQALPYRDRDDEPHGMVLSFTDVTELKRAEHFSRRVLDSLFAFAGVCSPEGVLLLANRAALTAAGLEPDEVLNKPFEQAYWWSYSETVQARLRQAIERAASGETVGKDRLPQEAGRAAGRGAVYYHRFPAGADA